ncbi:Regulatory-associated protein of TOR, variant 2 [Trifolium repens]|nr:Regulatory-associated protein of TOR, variant 2 [Trifolium repens]
MRSGHRHRKPPPTIISITVMLDSHSQRNFMHRPLITDLPFCCSQGEAGYFSSRIWNHEEATLLNNFDNHDFPDKGISKLCLVNELDDSLLLAASSDGNIRVWKDYSLRGKQKLATAFSSIHGHKPGVRSWNAVVDWQQQSGYLYASGEMSSIMVWDLDKEQLVNAIPSSSECSVSALVAFFPYVVKVSDVFSILASEVVARFTHDWAGKECGSSSRNQSKTKIQ